MIHRIVGTTGGTLRRPTESARVPPTRRLLLTVLLAVLALPAAASAQTPEGNVPGVSSPNIDFVTSRPGTTAISGVFSPSAPFFYVSGLDSLTVFDVKNPANPVPVGKLVNAIFENEAMTMGERRLPDGKIQRFLLVGNDAAEVAVDSGGVSRGRIGGRQLTIVDVTDPANPRVVGMTPDPGTLLGQPVLPGANSKGAVTTSTHTVACVTANCEYAYTAGQGVDPDGNGPLKPVGKVSIIDLRDLTKPVEVKTVTSPAAGPNPVFPGGSGHHWSIDGAGIGTHTGSGGIAMFDVSDPLNPRILEASDANGIKTPYNDFILHNAQRPNPLAFAPGQPANVANGNVLLVTEEDYASEGDEVECDKAGTFQTWEIKSLDPGPFAAANPLLEPGKGTIAPLDIINAPLEGGGGTSTPIGAFCSAHWFDYHQSGIVAQAYYQQGLRLIDVRNPRDLKQFGFFTGTAGETWDAYWAPQRDRNGAAIPGLKTNLVYTVDAVRGVEVFRVRNLPADKPAEGAATNATGGPSPAPPGSGGSPGKGPDQPGPGNSGSSSQPAGIGPTGLRCTQPRSRVARVSRVTRRGVRMRGRASSKTCTIVRVRVAVGRQVTKKRCRFLQSDGTFGAKRLCRRPDYMLAKGTKKWRFAMKTPLPKGAYLLSSRSTDAAGNFEPTAKRKNIVYRQIRGG